MTINRIHNNMRRRIAIASVFGLLGSFFAAHSTSAAFGTNTVWEVRPTGSDTNGGGFLVGSSGTDYSQQNAPQVATTDGVANGTTTLTSATASFSAAHVGNVVYLAGGSNSLAGTRRQITSVTNATTVVLDSSVATGTGLTLNLGGCLASPGMAAAGVNASGGGNTVYARAGTYPVSTTANVAGGLPQPTQYSYWIGYNATRGDATLWGTFPSLQATASSSFCFQVAGNEVLIQNFEFNGNSGAGYTGVVGLTSTGGRYAAYNCRAKNCSPSGSNGAFGSGGIAQWNFCEALATTGAGFRGAGSASGCYSHDNTGQGFVGGSPMSFTDCVAAGNTGDGFVYSAGPLRGANCTAVDNGGNGFNCDFVTSTLVNCVAYNNASYGFGTSSSANGALILLTNCGGGANGSGNYPVSYLPASNVAGFVGVSADPFISRAARNLALNNTGGAGAALRGAGQRNTVGGNTLSLPDIGAAQTRSVIRARQPQY